MGWVYVPLDFGSSDRAASEPPKPWSPPPRRAIVVSSAEVFELGWQRPSNWEAPRPEWAAEAQASLAAQTVETLRICGIESSVLDYADPLPTAPELLERTGADAFVQVIGRDHVSSIGRKVALLGVTYPLMMIVTVGAARMWFGDPVDRLRSRSLCAAAAMRRGGAASGRGRSHSKNRRRHSARSARCSRVGRSAMQ
jgi:hypothetical protein